MPRYDFACPECAERFDIERPIAEAADPCPCPCCGVPARRRYTVPKLLFKPDPNDVRPIWHSHGAYGHAHPRGRGAHGHDGSPRRDDAAG